MDIKTSLHRSQLFTEIKTDKAIIDLYHCQLKREGGLENLAKIQQRPSEAFRAKGILLLVSGYVTTYPTRQWCFLNYFKTQYFMVIFD